MVGIAKKINMYIGFINRDKQMKGQQIYLHSSINAHASMLSFFIGWQNKSNHTEC